MNKQLKIAERDALSEQSDEAVFDRACLARNTMNDAALQSEVLTLFIDQLAKIEFADWSKLDLNFEMHALRGAAAALGALQIEIICTRWQDYGPALEAVLKPAIAAFCTEATRR
jgi:hypothetical protein